MDVGITLMPVSMWYKTIKETGTGSVTVKSDSKNESPCCLIITGIDVAYNTLQWLQKVNNVVVMNGYLDHVNIGTTTKVYIRTDTNPYQIYKVTDGVKTDLYPYSRFSSKRFPFLYKGTNQFTVSGASITVEGRILYETV